MKKVFEGFKEYEVRQLNEKFEPIRIVAYLNIGKEDFIKAKAEEDGIDVDWKVLNKEIQDFENFVMNFLRKSKDYEGVTEQGHDGQDSLVVLFTVTNKKITEAWLDLIDRDERFDFIDSSYAADKKLFDASDNFISKTKFLKLDNPTFNDMQVITDENINYQ